jgi:hypothetical protein
MKWSRRTIILFILSMTSMVISGFMILMLLGTFPGTPEHRFAQYAFPLSILGFLGFGGGAWLNHRRQRETG